MQYYLASLNEILIVYIMHYINIEDSTVKIFNMFIKYLQVLFGKKNIKFIQLLLLYCLRDQTMKSYYVSKIVIIFKTFNQIAYKRQRHKMFIMIHGMYAIPTGCTNKNVF